MAAPTPTYDVGPNLNNYDEHDCQLEDSKPLPALVPKLVFIKGLCDLGLAFSLMFSPGLLYNGPLMEVLSDLTTLPTTSGTTNPTSAFELATLIMGMAFAALAASESGSKEGIKTIGIMNGITSLTGLSICALSPYKHATTFILFLALMNGAWYATIMRAGRFGLLDSLGLGGKGTELLGKCRLCSRGAGEGRREGWSAGYEGIGNGDDTLSEKRLYEGRDGRGGQE